MRVRQACVVLTGSDLQGVDVSTSWRSPDVGECGECERLQARPGAGEPSPAWTTQGVASLSLEAKETLRSTSLTVCLSLWFSHSFFRSPCYVTYCLLGFLCRPDFLASVLPVCCPLFLPLFPLPLLFFLIIYFCFPLFSVPPALSFAP